jgi:hypothetical protein
MKQNSTIIPVTVVPLYFFFHSIASIMAQPDYSFSNAVLESGKDLSIGSIYRFANAKPGVDALVKVEKMTGGVKFSAIDESWTGFNEAFQSRRVSREQ